MFISTAKIVENQNKVIIFANNLTEKINNVFSNYDFAEGFKDKVRNFCSDFADKRELNRLLENIKPYKMADGETMYFSCHEFEC